MRKVCRYGLSISLLVLIDQCIKLFIDRYWFNSTFTIINNLLRFRPIINVNLSWGGSLDFIQIPLFFTFDLKDCYLSLAVLIFVFLSMYHERCKR